MNYITFLKSFPLRRACSDLSEIEDGLMVIAYKPGLFK
jgi:hypothetical protein